LKQTQQQAGVSRAPIWLTGWLLRVETLYWLKIEIVFMQKQQPRCEKKKMIYLLHEVMPKISELETDVSIWWAEQLVVNDWWQTKKVTVDTILARTHNHTTSQVTDFNTAVDAKIDVPTDTEKITPVDTDVFALWDTIRKKVTWANIKATLKTYFDTLYHPINALRSSLWNWKIFYTNWSGVETELALWASWTVLTSNGASSAPSFQSQNFIKVMKTADESRTSTTKYSFIAVLHLYLPALGDFKYRHTWPASPAVVAIHRRSVQPAGTAFNQQAIDAAYSWSDIIIAWTSNNPAILIMEWIIHNWANAWNFAIQRAQNISDVNATIVRAGSFIEYTVV